MTSPTYADKAEVIATLRSRGLHARADWVDRTFPDRIDTHRNAALLRTLDIDPLASSNQGAAVTMHVSAPAERERDRDAAGRPRNARPRDEFGRPLPHDAPGAAAVPAELALPPD